VSTAFTAGELASYWPAAGSVTVAPPGVRPAQRTEAPGEWEALVAARGIREPYWLNVGWIAPHKNQAVLMEALAMAREHGVATHLYLAGPNGGQLQDPDTAEAPYVRHLAWVAERLGLRHGVDFTGLGGVGDRELELLYCHAAALVMPTQYEGFGFPTLEAVSLGCPVACSDIPPLVETLEVVGAAAELFDPDEPIALAAALERLPRRDPAARARLEASAAEVPRRFSWSLAGHQYFGAFARAMAGGG
jgi:glycosyltransferase involved in cell wall biosynthesis